MAQENKALKDQYKMAEEHLKNLNILHFNLNENFKKSQTEKENALKNLKNLEAAFEEKKKSFTEEMKPLLEKAELVNKLQQQLKEFQEKAANESST